MKSLASFVLFVSCLPAQTPAPLPTAEEWAEARRALVDWGGLNRYGSEDSEIKPPKPGEDRVVFLGATLTAHWGKGAAPFFPGKPYFNRGIEKQTTPQMLVRFRQDVVGLSPKVVVIEGGLNDIGMVMGPGSEGTIADHIESMIDIAKAHGIRVVIASITTVCDCYNSQIHRRPVGKIAAINGTLRGIAKETGSVYLNYNSVLMNPDSRQLKKEYTDNGIDPNDAGYLAMAPLAEKAIADALALK